MSCVVHKDTKIGERVIIGQNTTIGRSLDPADFPTIGNDVYISAGARIIGNIHVGNNVIIGANAVVNKNVEDNCIVAGVPTKVIRKIDCSIWDLLKNMKFPQREVILSYSFHLGNEFVTIQGCRLVRNGGLYHAA